MTKKILLIILFHLLSSSILSFDLKTGTIYKVYCQVTDKVYIGRTIDEIENAMKMYRTLFECYKRGTYKTYDTVFKVMANDDYNVTVLEEIPRLANDTDFFMTLKKRKRFYIEQYENSVNKFIPLRSGKEYYKKNFQRIAQVHKQYREENKEIISQKIKKLHEKNKKIYSQKAKEYYYSVVYPRTKQLPPRKVTCDVCDAEINLSSLVQHNKTKRHLTALAKLNTGLESGPHYRQHLSELLNAHKETCEQCGGVYSKRWRIEHNETKRHLTALAKLKSESESDPQYQQQLSEMLDSKRVKCDVCDKMFMFNSLYKHKKSMRHLTALAKLNQS